MTFFDNGFLTGIVRWIMTILSTIPVVQNIAHYIDEMVLNQPTIYGLVTCIGAACNLVIPISAVGIVLSIKIPVMFLTFIIRVIWRIKSLIPTMGGD